MRKTKLKGSFTVESCFIIPIIVIVVLIIIYTALYLYDYTRIRTLANQTFNRSHMIIREPHKEGLMDIDFENINRQKLFHLLKGDKSIEKELIEKKLREDLNGSLIIAEIEKLEIDFSWGGSRLLIVAKTYFPIPNLLGVFNFSEKEIKVLIEGANHQPAEFIRMADVIMETGGRVKGVGKIEEAVGKFISKP